MTWRPLKSFCVGLPVYGLNIPAADYVPEGVRFLRTSDITSDGAVAAADADAVFVEETVVDSEHVLKDGDLLFSRSGTLGRCLRYRPEHGSATFAGYLVRFRPLPTTEPRYLGYCAQAAFFQDAVAADAISSTISNFNAERYANIRLPSWPFEQQRLVADYLDAATARIDALIANKCRMIGVLEERWQTVMHDGVAGLLTSPAAAIRRAAAPWLETIPSDWREAKLTLVAQLGSGHTPSRQHPEWWESPTIPWITTGEVARLRDDRVEYVSDTREMISELGMANSAATLHPAGTVVLCRTASAGYSGIMSRDMATSQDFATWTCGPVVRPRFLLLCLRVMRQDLLGRLAMGSTHQTIYMPDVESIRIPLPPVEDQDAIVAAVYNRLPAIDDAIRKLDRQIDLLREHRQALISAAVTGELELAEAAA